MSLRDKIKKGKRQQSMDEDKLLTYIRENYLTDLVKADSEYSCFDCSSEEFDMLIELKCRTENWDDLLLEKKEV